MRHAAPFPVAATGNKGASSSASAASSSERGGAAGGTPATPPSIGAQGQVTEGDFSGTRLNAEKPSSTGNHRKGLAESANDLGGKELRMHPGLRFLFDSMLRLGLLLPLDASWSCLAHPA
jgi:hypothetical protein